MSLPQYPNSFIRHFAECVVELLAQQNKELIELRELKTHLQNGYRVKGGGEDEYVQMCFVCSKLTTPHDLVECEECGNYVCFDICNINSFNKVAICIICNRKNKNKK